MYLLKNDKKYTLNELHKGMKVNAEQLSEILDTYIILTDAHLIKDDIGIGVFEGVVDTISEEFVQLRKPNSTLIFNDSYEREECCEYE